MARAAVCALCATLAVSASAQEPVIAPPDAPVDADADVNVTDYGTVDLAVQDTDLAQILQMLSIQSKKNIITSRNVSATVTANLYDVTLYEALDAILRVNGYGYIEEGNFIYVYTQAELEEMERAQRQTESRIFELEYLSAADANEFITPLLSEAGQSSFRGDVQAGFQPSTSDGGADGYAFTAKLVVSDYPEVLDQIAELIAELDSPPQQVLVEATILQTTLDEANAFGIDFTVLGNLNFTNLANPLSAVNDLLRGSDSGTDVDATSEQGFKPGDNRAAAGVSTVGNTTGPGGLKIGVLTDEIAVFLRVLDEVSDTTILARPKVMVLNRQRAEVLVGARIGYLSTTATETTTTQSVEFLDTGIHLVFRPFISRNGTIRLELSPSASEASLRTVTDAQGLQVTIPDELTNELTTNVRIRDGQTAVLGGLFRESTRISRRQVPLFGDIPLLGAAFRGQDDAVERDEIIFLIRPTIMHDEMVFQSGRDTLAYGDAVRAGARNGLLPFSRDKMTTNHNQDAIDSMNKGDVDKALYHINNSLRLNPNQPEIIRLRQQITGDKERENMRSIMERVFRNTLGAAAAADAGEAHAMHPLQEFGVSVPAPDDPAEPDESDEPASRQAFIRESAEADELAAAESFGPDAVSTDVMEPASAPLVEYGPPVSAPTAPVVAAAEPAAEAPGAAFGSFSPFSGMFDWMNWPIDPSELRAIGEEFEVAEVEPSFERE